MRHTGFGIGIGGVYTNTPSYLILSVKEYIEVSHELYAWSAIVLIIDDEISQDQQHWTCCHIIMHSGPRIRPFPTRGFKGKISVI